MDNAYNYIQESFKNKKSDLTFPPSLLDQLSDDERKTVEGKILKLCMNGYESYFKFLEHFKFYKPEEFITPDTIKSWGKYKQSKMLNTLFSTTHDMSYINEMIDISQTDINTFSMLTFICKENKSDSELYSYLYNRLKTISGSDDLYDKMFRNRLNEVENMNTNKKELSLDAVKAGLFGFATADALGVPVEFTSREARSVRPLKEMVGYGTYKVPEGTWSDDTSMTIAGMDSLGMCNGALDFDDIMRKYCAWYSSAYYTATDELFDIGIGTRQALERYASNITNSISSGSTNEQNNGNGSLMRMLPMVYYLYSNNFDEAKEVDLINKFSAMTHGHEVSQLGCKIYYDFMKELLDGKSKEDAYEHIQNIDYSKFYSNDSISRYRRILDGNLDQLDSEAISSSGYVVSTLEASLWTTLRTDNYEDAVVTAVNLGEDTDTVGAITGSMAGTIYGEESIPERWTSKLRKKEFLNDICSRFTTSINLKPQRISERFYDIYVLGAKYDNNSGLTQMLADSSSSQNDSNPEKTNNL